MKRRLLNFCRSILSQSSRDFLSVVTPQLLLLVFSPNTDANSTYESVGKPFLETYCLSCHDNYSDVELHQLGPIDANNSTTWKTIWEQVALKEMPPKEEEHQPDQLKRLGFSQWITSELERVLSDKGGFNSHHTPEKANHLDHDLLFGTNNLELIPASTPARLWRIHPDEHLTRINALLHPESEYDAEKPGLRARGDAVGSKVLYGHNRIIGWIGGANQYRNSALAYIAPLSTLNQRGINNYPLFYSVNQSETLQILSQGPEVLRFMAYGPDAEPYQFVNSMSELDEKYQAREFSGSRKSLFYDKTTQRPITPIHDLMNSPGVSQEHLKESVYYLYQAMTGRPPTSEQAEQYIALVNESIRLNGKEKGAFAGLSAIFLDRHALFRSELATEGSPDQYERVMLSGYELALAINAAFSYLPPDHNLQNALKENRLATREDVEREIERILNDDSIRKPRLLQFFQSYFGYDRGRLIDKDMGEVRQLLNMNLNKFLREIVVLQWTTDRFVEKIIDDDQDVFYRLLTDDWAVIDDKSALYYGEYLGQVPDAEWLEKQANKKKKGNNPKPIPHLATFQPAAFSKDAENILYVRVPPSFSTTENPANTLEKVSTRYLAKLPVGQRMGILTHPSWLLSHSDAMDNHAIHRGKWVREHLLGGAVPDVPITVDAMLPDEPEQTLRHRMRVTREEYCWKCHQKMDPLGLPFEIYNHVGLYRATEEGKPVIKTGAIVGSGIPELDGPVENVFELIQKLAESERAEQVFVRYAFRYWMGRNETIHDGPILRDAHKAYKNSGGSMKALLLSLLTSDAFLYRTVPDTSSWAFCRQIHQEYVPYQATFWTVYEQDKYVSFSLKNRILPILNSSNCIAHVRTQYSSKRSLRSILFPLDPVPLLHSSVQ